MSQYKAELIARFKQQEETLLHTDFSLQADRLNCLFHPELFEISPIGKYTSRSEIVDWLLAKPAQQRWQLSDFKAVEISVDTVLVCYQANSINQGKVKNTGTLRSSIWRLQDGNWLLQFHQATPN